MVGGIKIQLNSEEAIRSLISGDPAFELEIKNKITCAIADGYEKINKEVAAKSIDLISRHVSGQIWAELTETRREGYNTVVYLKPEIKELIAKEIDWKVRTLVSDHFSDAREDLLKRINERIDGIAEEIVKRTTTEAFENSVRSEVIRRYDAIQKAMDAEVRKG